MVRFIGSSLVISQEPNICFSNLLSLVCDIQRSKTTHTSGIRDHQYFRNIYKANGVETLLDHLGKTLHQVGEQKKQEMRDGLEGPWLFHVVKWRVVSNAPKLHAMITFHNHVCKRLRKPEWMTQRGNSWQWAAGALRSFWKPLKEISLFDPPNTKQDIPGKDKVEKRRIIPLPLDIKVYLFNVVRTSLLIHCLQMA